MKNVVVIGAGTGGALVANLLSRKLPGEWSVTVIDPSPTHYYQPGFLFLPFRLYGYENEADVARPIKTPLDKSVSFRNEEALSIDREGGKVTTNMGVYPYDYLVLAMGTVVQPDEVEGLSDAIEAGSAGMFYTFESAMALQKKFDTFTEGRLILHIADMPIKCPVAPIEFVFLADYYFHEKGCRDKVDIELVTPLTGAFTKPQAAATLAGIAAEKGITITPNFVVSEVDAEKKSLTAFDGRERPFDLLVSIPPHYGSDVIEDAGIGNGLGFAHTDQHTLKVVGDDRIYAIGDNTDVPTSKAGSVAHFEAEIVVENILREVEGKEPLPDFDGHSNCFIESGYHKALLIDFNYETEPLHGSFPLPMVGPFSLLEESTLNHWGKMAFKQVYWNLLVTGHLPGDPLLPSHMSMTGKKPAEVIKK
jgi:sulfide:quinone oxidoreductase